MPVDLLVTTPTKANSPLNFGNLIYKSGDSVLSVFNKVAARMKLTKF